MINIEPSEIEIKELISLFDKKKFDQLINLTNDLLKQYPNSILIHNIQGVLYTELKSYNFAKDLFIKVINLNPKFTDGYYNLANIYNKLDEEDKAIENYKKVIELDYNYFKAHNNLGNIFRKKGLNNKAIECYLSTLEINSNYRLAYYNLAGALQFYIINKENKYINKHLLYLLEEKVIVRPNSITSNIINSLFLNTDLKKILSLTKNINSKKNLNYIVESLVKNTLLLQFMKVCPIPDYFIERKFKLIRKEILNQIYKSNFEKIYIKFLISLSIQCFLNEYIYEKSNDEIKKIKEINERVKKNLKNNNKVQDLEILCLSCYKPLNNFNWCNKIIASSELDEIFELHLNHKMKEKLLTRKIKSISIVKNKISKNVKNQYEENPYPIWVNLGLSFEPRNIKDVINDSNLNLDLEETKISEKPEILVAGCGTGQHAITTASKYKKAKILALDLSFKSLSYAKRKADELKIKNINFIQGDLLDLELINKKFDLIESVGVLHHMEDPFKGWRILSNCLMDNSLMLIGLYSDKARQHIVQIKDKIIQRKLQSNYKNIVSFRKDLIENSNPKWSDIKKSPDFYSVSGVRDLLFHEQEHRFTIKKIKEYLNKLGLVFLGFEDKLVIEMFKKTYKNKNDLYNLDVWEEYEKFNPRTFAGMYQFWCKKKQSGNNKLL